MVLVVPPLTVTISFYLALVDGAKDLWKVVLSGVHTETRTITSMPNIKVGSSSILTYPEMIMGLDSITKILTFPQPLPKLISTKEKHAPGHRDAGEQNALRLRRYPAKCSRQQRKATRHIPVTPKLNNPISTIATAARNRDAPGVLVLATPARLFPKQLGQNKIPNPH